MSRSGGKPVDPGLIARVSGKFRDTLEVWFGPLNPPQVSAPPDLAPRRFDYAAGVNLVTQPRNYEAVTFQQMRDLADSLDLVRIAIETRKDQIAKLKWSFRLKKEDGESKKVYAARNAKDKRVSELTQFFQSPDGEHDWDGWLRMLLEDLLVIDAVTLGAMIDDNGTVCADKFDGKQKLARLEVLDGSTIKRVIDDMGRTQTPPGIAYQQILKGVPAIDLTADQIVYRPRNIRAHKMFGFSPVEQIIITINVALRRQMSTLAYYTDGNVPEAICQTPVEWNKDNIKEFQDWFDSVLAGNLQQRRRINFIPNAGGKDAIQFTKEAPLKSDIDEWLARIVCWAFSISPQALIKQMNRASAQQQKESSDEEGVAPTLQWLSNLINSLVRKYWLYDDIEFAWDEAKDQDQNLQSQIYDRALRNGTLTLNEVREDIGEEPIGPAGDRNLVYTASGVTPIDTAIEHADNPPAPVVPPGSAAGEGGEPKPGEPNNSGEPGKGNPPKPGAQQKAVIEQIEERIWQRLRKRLY